MYKKKCIFCSEKTDEKGLYCKSKKCGLSQVPRILVDWELEKLIKNGNIFIEPLLNSIGPIDKEKKKLSKESLLRLEADKQIWSVGIDLRMDTRFRRIKYMEKETIDPLLFSAEDIDEVYELKELNISKGESLILQPSEFILTQSLEYICLPRYITCRLDGRSSLGRLGLNVHSTARCIDPGFHGHIAFELSNVGKMPFKIHPLMRIARLTFHLTEDVENPYNGQFQLQVEIKPPRPTLQPFLIGNIEKFKGGINVQD
jgi:dCTP deaminase